jgi:hypothetical protein
MLRRLKYSPHLTDKDRMRVFLAILVLAIAAASGTATGQNAQTNRPDQPDLWQPQHWTEQRIGQQSPFRRRPYALRIHFGDEGRGALVRRAGDQVNVLVSLRPRLRDANGQADPNAGRC